MKCPKCGNDLRESKKTPGYFLCDSCKKKFSQETLKKFQSSGSASRKENGLDPTNPEDEIDSPVQVNSDSVSEQHDQEPKYSNIPPEAIRNKREQEMKANYEALLNIKDPDTDDSADLDEKPSAVLGGFRLLIGIVSIFCAAFLAYQAYDSGIFTTFYTHARIDRYCRNDSFHLLFTRWTDYTVHTPQ